MNFEDHKIEILISSAVVLVFGLFIVNILWNDTTPAFADYQYELEINATDSEEIQSPAEIRIAKVHYNEAVRLANLGRTKRALSYLKSSLENYPHFVPSHVKLQDLYINMGKEDSINTVYAELKNNDPENPAYIYLNARLLEFEEGRAEYERIKEIDPDFYWSYIDLGHYHLAKGEFDTAEAEFMSAIQINPALIEGQIGLGIAFDQQGEYFDAIKQYNMGLIINEKTAPEAYLHLGMIYETLSDTVRSLEYMRSFLEYVKTGPEYEFIKSRVDSIEIRLKLKEIEVLPDTSGIH
ncbi:MAG: hypothetical protein GY863_03950 [bacterium]|nr:hypothetical protein [bacterium]